MYDPDRTMRRNYENNRRIDAQRRQKMSQEERDEEDLEEKIRKILLEKEKIARNNRPIILLDGDNW